MALPHAHLLDIIDIGPLGSALRDAVSTSLIKTDRVQLLQLVLPARRNLPQHHVGDECTIHCLEGDVEVETPAGVRRLGPGQLVVLPAGHPYSLGARIDSAVLMTLLLATATPATAAVATPPEPPKNSGAVHPGGTKERARQSPGLGT